MSRSPFFQETQEIVAAVESLSQESRTYVRDMVMRVVGVAMANEQAAQPKRQRRKTKT